MLQGLTFSAVVQQLAVTAIQDLWEILVPSDAILKLTELKFSQNSDAGDSEEEFLHVSIRRVTGLPTSGSGGTTPTPRPTQSGFPASGATVEANNITQLTGGTNIVLDAFDVNVRQPELVIPIDGNQFIFSPGERLLVELETAPGDELTWTQGIKYEEIGG